MDATNNLANQEVFAMARGADPYGKRTVGIITKCDAVIPGDELAVLKIAKNQVENLTHGWIAVRNRSTREIHVTIENRHRKEDEFFSTQKPWTELDKDHVGIAALKLFLGSLLYDHICSEFPDVITDIENGLLEAQTEQNRLGPCRQNPSGQRRYLTRIATTYQNEMGKALSGNYDASLDLRSPLKLCMHLRKYGDQFAESMLNNGHARPFCMTSGKQNVIDPAYQRQPETGLEEAYEEGNDEVDGGNGEEDEDGDEDIYGWIRCHYRDCRGPELPGTINPSVLETLFLQQSQPWESIASEYLRKVTSAVLTYNQEVMGTLVPDEEARRNFMDYLRPFEKQAQHNASEQLLKILNDERGSILQTVNHYFADTLSSIRQDRVLGRLKSAGFHDNARFEKRKVLTGVHLSNEDQADFHIHGTLKSLLPSGFKAVYR